MTTRKLFKINSTGSLAIVLPKSLCGAKALRAGDEVTIELGKHGELILDKKV